MERTDAGTLQRYDRGKVNETVYKQPICLCIIVY